MFPSELERYDRHCYWKVQTTSSVSGHTANGGQSDQTKGYELHLDNVDRSKGEEAELERDPCVRAMTHLEMDPHVP